MLCHGVLNMHKTKHGVDSTEDILRDGMQYGFERMCIVHGAMDAMVCFLVTKPCIQHYINIDILTKLYLYVCRGKRLKRRNVKIKQINNTLC